MVLESEPIDILLDADGDIDLSTGGPVFTHGVQAVGQGVKISVQIIRGECIYDLELGVPWFENDVVDANTALLGFAFNRLKILTEIRKAVLAAPHDVTITELTVDLNGETREMSGAIRLKTKFGDTEIAITPGDF